MLDGFNRQRAADSPLATPADMKDCRLRKSAKRLRPACRLFLPTRYDKASCKEVHTAEKTACRLTHLFPALTTGLIGKQFYFQHLRGMLQKCEHFTKRSQIQTLLRVLNNRILTER